MIISDKEKFAFVHIPKCAGTSVRARIEHLDDRYGAYSSRLENHSELGLLNYVHLPLATLAEHFSHDFECIQTYRSLAVLRDPSQRFISSVSQYCNRYTDTDMRSHSVKTLKREVWKLIDLLEGLEIKSPGSRLPAEFIHFQQQHHYTHLNGLQVVKHLVDVSQVDALLTSLLGHNVVMDEPSIKENESRVYRSPRARLLALATRAVAPRLGAALPSVASKWVRAHVYSPLTHQFDEVFQHEKVRSFIATYYELDRHLSANRIGWG